MDEEDIPITELAYASDDLSLGDAAFDPDSVSPPAIPPKNTLQLDVILSCNKFIKFFHEKGFHCGPVSDRC